MTLTYRLNLLVQTTIEIWEKINQLCTVRKIDLLGQNRSPTEARAMTPLFWLLDWQVGVNFATNALGATLLRIWPWLSLTAIIVPTAAGSPRTNHRTGECKQRHQNGENLCHNL